MPVLTPQLRRGLVGLCAALLIAGVVGAFAVEPERDDDTVFAGERDTTSTSFELGVGGGDGPADPGSVLPGATSTTSAGPARRAPGTTTRGGGSTATTASKPVNCPAAGPSTTSAPSATPGPAKAPAPGKYCYTVEVTGEANDSGQRELLIEAGEDGPGITRRVSSFSSGPQSFKATSAWGSDGIRQEKVVITMSQGGQQVSIDCDWQPDALEYAQPLSQGAKWQIDSSCESTVQGFKVNLRQQTEKSVVGTASTTVGGTTVNVWVVRTTGKVTATLNGAPYRSDEVDVTTYFEPTRGLDVYEKATTKTSGSGGSSATTTSERRLARLTPS